MAGCRPTGRRSSAGARHPRAHVSRLRAAAAPRPGGRPATRAPSTSTSSTRTTRSCSGPPPGDWPGGSGRPLVFTYHTLYDKYAHYVPPRAAWSPARPSAGAPRSPHGRPRHRALEPRWRLRAQGVGGPIEVLPTGVDLDTLPPGRPSGRPPRAGAPGRRPRPPLRRAPRPGEEPRLPAGRRRPRRRRGRGRRRGRDAAATSRQVAAGVGLGDRVEFRGGVTPTASPRTTRRPTSSCSRRRPRPRGCCPGGHGLRTAGGRVRASGSRRSSPRASPGSWCRGPGGIRLGREPDPRRRRPGVEARDRGPRGGDAVRVHGPDRTPRGPVPTGEGRGSWT